MDYTSVDLVKLYGNVTQASDDTLLAGLVSAYSAQVDEFCHQVFGQATYTNRVVTAVIDADGVLTCYPPVPTMSSPTAFAYRYGRAATWLDISLSLLDVEPRDSGCVVRVLERDFRAFRGQRVQTRLSFTGGYADVNALPKDFELAVRRLIWWGYKLREAPLGKTALPALGEIVIPPSGWPRDIKEALRPYVRYIN